MEKIMAYPVDSKEIKLQFPVMLNGTKIDTLKLRRPKVRDQIIAAKMGKDDMEKEIKFFSLLTEVDDEVIQDLDLADFERLQEELKTFRKPA